MEVFTQVNFGEGEGRLADEWTARSFGPGWSEKRAVEFSIATETETFLKSESGRIRGKARSLTAHAYTSETPLHANGRPIRCESVTFRAAPEDGAEEGGRGT